MINVEAKMKHTQVPESGEEIIVAYVDEVKQQHEQSLSPLMDEVMSKRGRNALEYINPQKHLPNGSPHKEIPALAEADPVVMGTVARTGIYRFFMGSTAETILNRLNCSLVAIKPPGFVTPVSLGD